MQIMLCTEVADTDGVLRCQDDRLVSFRLFGHASATAISEQNRNISVSIPSNRVREGDRAYLFIDGAYFQKTVEALSPRICADKLVPIKYPQLAHRFQRIIYYDALPSQKSGQSRSDHERMYERKRQFLNELRRTPNFHVRDGITRIRGGASSRLEQKGVDTWLAIDALQYAFRGIIDTAEVITGDLDLYPLFEALVLSDVSARGQLESIF